MNTSDFDYKLPPERIAQSPAVPRDSSRLMVLDRGAHTIRHHHFFDLPDFLRPGDLLIVNESKVFKARLQGFVGATPASPVEIFLLRPEGAYWLALGQPGKKLRKDAVVAFADGTTCRVTEKREDGILFIDFAKPAEEIFTWADRIGTVPTPPYINPTETPTQTEQSYQTVYAKTVGSVAAPTAGFHFTPELLAKLNARGITIAHITLHVGIGTFRPMKTETLEEHIMHEEWVDVPDETVRAIQETKQHGGRVIAVGTTTVRALESNTHHGFTNLFIAPGFTFRHIDGLITNFHLPKSTLLVLVSAFAGRERILNAYQEAIKERYRFYSFGDAMLIL
jgi:S-adenosylmethionine:tRNA ribosyltransferase-isomerase